MKIVRSVLWLTEEQGNVQSIVLEVLQRHIGIEFADWIVFTDDEGANVGEVRSKMRLGEDVELKGGGTLIETDNRVSESHSLVLR